MYWTPRNALRKVATPGTGCVSRPGKPRDRT